MINKAISYFKKYKQKRKIGCLFGSGISLKAGFKGVLEITDIVLSGKGVSSHTDSEYHFAPPTYSHMGIKKCEDVRRVTNFLKFIYDMNKQYNDEFKDEQNPNYEDLFYTVRQIHDEIYGEQESFIIRNFIKNININSSTMLKAKSDLYKDFTFEDLINATMTYINNVITHLLYKPQQDISYLSILPDILSKYKINIFLLNHDLLIESYFDQHNIRYNDGFGVQKGDLKHFDLDMFCNNNNVNLLKLHGSSNWYRFRQNNTDWRGEFIGKCVHNDIRHIKDENGEYIDCLWNYSTILIGTFNKLIDYNAGVFAELYSEFTKKLSQINYLLISGYGFGDKGINTKIIEWYYGNSNNKIILVHKHPDDLTNSARGAIRNKWDRWIEEGRLKIINKWFEEMTLNDVIDFIG